jgi:hypothetical protein
MANANGRANTITLKAGTYTRTTTNLLSVTGVLTIKGQDATTTILDGFTILNEAAGTLTLQGLTLRNGFFLLGGAISNRGALTIIDCILTRNTSFNGPGGGLFNSGTVTIDHTTFDGNSAGQAGGGLANGFASFIEGGTVTIANSTFVDNRADGGGGLANFNMGTMTLTNTTVAQNVTSVHTGGGINNSNGIVLLQNTTVAENHGDVGFLPGGGIVNFGGIVLLQNTIIARNDIPGFPPPQIVPSDCSGPVTSLGNNLIGDPTATGCTITLQPSDLTGDPGLGTFTDNGKPGNGHFPLLSSSQAIDAGNDAVCFRRDQLGRRRIGPCDIGAISFRNKDDGRHEEKDDHQHEENLVSRVQGSR